jgi:hypothetical protein
MSRSTPQKIVIQFSDGSSTESPFHALPAQLQFDILRQPFASRPSPEPEKEKFVLLEWEDGWTEVVEVDATCTEINRYYVISRPEDIGRLSLNKPDGYPELIEIVRKPLNLKKITFLNTFQLTLERSDREGKKTDHFFELTKKGDTLTDAVRSFKKVVKEEGIDLQKLQSQGPDHLGEQYEKIRRKMGIKATHRQQDVLDFMAFLAKIAD